MAKEFCYSFSIDMDKRSIIIEVKESIFELIFENSSCEPTVEDIEEGYVVNFIEVFTNIDVKYKLGINYIKEEIILKNNECQDSLKMRISLNNCSIKNDGKFWNILDNNGKFIYSFENPKITYENHNYGKDIDDVAKMTVDDEYICYEFMKEKIEIEQAYPVTIDPSFVFPIPMGFGNSRGYFLKSNNELFLTGDETRERFVEESDGDYVSDDVVYGRKVSLIFPYLVSSIRKIGIIASSGKDSWEFLVSDIKNGTSGEIQYSYVDCEIPKDVNSKVNFLVKVGLASDVYGSFVLEFARNINFVNSPLIEMSNQSVFSGSSISFPVRCSVQESFSPINFYIIPFYFKFEEEYGNGYPSIKIIRKDNFSSFLANLKSMESNSPNISNYYFEINTDQFPTQKSELFVSDNYNVYRGYNESFMNKIMIGIESSVNNRNNFQQNNAIEKRYIYLSENDFSLYIKKKYGIFKDGKIPPTYDYLFAAPKIYPSFYLKFNSGFYLGSDDSGSTITEMGESDIHVNHTLIEFNENIFEQNFVSGEVYMASQNMEYSDIYDGVYDEGYLVGEVEGKIISFKILKSFRNKLIIDGKKYKYLNQMYNFSIFLYYPKDIIIEYTSKSIKNKLFPSKINSDGSILFKDIRLVVEKNKKISIESTFINKESRFKGIKTDHISQ